MSSSQSKTLVQQTVHLFVMEGDFKHPPSTTTITPPALLRNPACECQETERVVVRETEREEGGGFGLCIELPKLIPREHSVLRSPPTQAPPPTHTFTHIHTQCTRTHTQTSPARTKIPQNKHIVRKQIKRTGGSPHESPSVRPFTYSLLEEACEWVRGGKKWWMNEWMTARNEWMKSSSNSRRRRGRGGGRRRTQGARITPVLLSVFFPPLYSPAEGSTAARAITRHGEQTHTVHTPLRSVCVGGGGDKPVHKYSAARFMRILLLRWFIVCSRAPNQACDAKDGWWRVCVCVMGGGDGVVLL